MDSLRSFGSQASDYAKANPKTMKYLLIGLGILAVILIGWFIYKKMKKENFAPNCQDAKNCICSTGNCAQVRDANTGKMKLACVADPKMKTGCRCTTCPVSAQSQRARK